MPEVEWEEKASHERNSSRSPPIEDYEAAITSADLPGQLLCKWKVLHFFCINKCSYRRVYTSRLGASLLNHIPWLLNASIRNQKVCETEFLYGSALHFYLMTRKLNFLFDHFDSKICSNIYKEQLCISFDGLKQF